VIHVAGRASPEDIQNEVRVIDKLFKTGGHQNIVAVFNHGWIEGNDHYTFDMELCALTLDEFLRGGIKNEIPPVNYFDFGPSVSEPFTCFKLRTITEHIARGLQFIHNAGEMHRDLKPRNGYCPIQGIDWFLVLFSVPDLVWKVADFGLSTEGTSKRASTTEQARGTECYRAPELLNRWGFSVCKKSDIWALGCILYELLFGLKAFSSDFNLCQHIQSGHGPTIPNLIFVGINERFKKSLSELMNAMFALNWWERPSAQDILNLFAVLSQKTTDVLLLNVPAISCNKPDSVGPTLLHGSDGDLGGSTKFEAPEISQEMQMIVRIMPDSKMWGRVSWDAFW
jgi:serine/threonine protein kinase